MNRKNGFYWVYVDFDKAGWTIAEWHEDYKFWLLFGYRCSFIDNEFIKIIDTPLTPPDSDTGKK